MGVMGESPDTLEAEWMENGLPDPSCMGGMTQMDGNLFFANCMSQEKRVNLVLHESTDGAVTWKKILDVDVCGGYADIAADATGLYVFYERFGHGWRGPLVLKKYSW